MAEAAKKMVAGGHDGIYLLRSDDCAENRWVVAGVFVVFLGIEGGPARFFEIAMADHKFKLVQLDWSYATDW